MIGRLWRRVRASFAKPNANGPARLSPEARWQVEVADDRIIVIDPDGKRQIIQKSDLACITIETNDTGPWGIDFRWQLSTAVSGNSCQFPQGATGESDALDHFQTLEGFDHSALADAMTCTDNATFIVWQA